MPDIDLEARVLNVLRTRRRSGEVEDAGKTPGALRPVTLSRHAMEALADQPRHLHTRLVFPNRYGKMVNPYRWNERTFKPGLRLAAVQRYPNPDDATQADLERVAALGTDFADHTCYEMRHTYATLALAAGATLEWIGKEMGHTNIATTRRYYARFTKRVDDWMRALLDANFDASDEIDGRIGDTSKAERF